MTPEHRVIIGPGMDGRINNIQFLTSNWKEKYGLDVYPMQIVWKDGEPFEPKLKRIVNQIDKFSSEGAVVSLVGCSASGSAMLNAFIERKSIIQKVVNVDGFLRPGTAKGFRSFEKRSSASIAFKESVLRFEKLEPKLTLKDKEKILTVRPMLGDELVPPKTVVINGALNAVVPAGEHVLSIATALVFYKPVIKFLIG